MKRIINLARRALMYVPGNDERKIAKAAALDVDGVILDLEDGVAFIRKDEARLTVQSALRGTDFGKSERLVRINSFSSGRAEEDLQVVLPGKPDAILLPKVDSPEVVSKLDRLLSEAEMKFGWDLGSISILVTIESAKAFLDLASICQASTRLVGLVFGAEDFTADSGITCTVEARELLYARSSLVMHAAAFGFQAIDMVQTSFSDAQLLEKECREGAELGFSGKQVIHPAQVEIVQRAFTPGDRAIQYALKVVEGAREAQDEGRGAFTLDGQMVDLPVVKRAESILMRARAAGIIE